MSTDAGLNVVGIESVQSIQNLGHTIPLVAEKSTMLRAYVLPEKLPFDMGVTGTLELRRGTETILIESESSVQLRGEAHPDLETQRRNLSTSLNFVLPEEWTVAGSIEARVTNVSPVLIGDPDATVVPHEPRLIEFVQGPNLRVHAIGFKVTDPNTGVVHKPADIQYDSLRSYLERAFPATAIEWTQDTVDAVEGFEPPYSQGDPSIEGLDPVWQKKFDLAAAHLMAIRAKEIDTGQDQRTHYYGLVYHPSDFFVGAVSNVPEQARPDVVGVGPAVVEDGSYGAHEFGHALGLLHPGFCGQRQEDEEFPPDYDGRLSSAAEAHHGLDFGGVSAERRVLPFDQFRDLMSYCNDVWLSAYNYKRAFERLKEEEALGPTGEQGEFYHVVGTYNFRVDEPKGKLQHVIAVGTKSMATEPPQSNVAVKGEDKNGKQLFFRNAELKHPSATDLYQDSGVFQMTVPYKDLFKLTLLVSGEEVDVWTREEPSA